MSDAALVTYCPRCEPTPDADPRYLVVDYCADHAERPVGVLDGLVPGCWWYGPGEVTGESQRAWCRAIHHGEYAGEPE